MVASLNRPGGNITGVTFLTVASGTKRLELLNALVPKAKIIGLLVNPENPGAGPTQNELRDAARALGLNLNIVGAHDQGQIDEAYTQFAEQHAEAIILAPDALFRVQMVQMISLAERFAIPTMYATRDFAEAGGLVSYGADIMEAYHQEGIYAGRILQGDKPSDLPILQSVKFELVVNAKTAKRLGLQVPDKVLALADDVIE